MCGACGAGEKDEPSTIGTTTTSSVAPAPTTVDAEPVATTTTTRRPSTATTTDATTVGRTSNTDAIANAADASPGGFAGVLLAAGLADKIEVDLLVQTGASPDASVIAGVVALLKQQSGKPVTLSGPRNISGGNVYSAQQIRDIGNASSQRQGHDDTAVLHLMYLRGQFERDGVLGVTVRGDTTAIFLDQVAGAATPLVSEARIERSVVTHEIGHVLGLVDLFLGTKRGDPDHPGHSRNPRSVMYWAVEADVVAQVLGGPPPVDFDSTDLADLARIRSGATS